MSAEHTHPRGPRLRIVAVNDVYLLDNLPRLRSLLEHHRRTDPADRLLLTLAGDFVAPSLLSSLDAGRGMIQCLNALGLTHATLGNHEDDLPTPQLSERIRELACPCLGTNVRGFTPELPRFDVVEVRGVARTVRVGLIGIVMDDLTVYQRVPFGGATLLPPNETARAEAIRLRSEERCDAVIALTHQSLQQDRALLAEPGPIDLVLGGHEHQVFLERVQNTWITKAGSDAFHAVVVDLEWGDDARPTVHVALEDVASYPEDPALRAQVDVHLERVKALGAATLVLLEPGAELSSVGTRVRQTSLGTLLATRVRNALHADVGLFNGGGIRGARIYRDRISYGDLETEVPFANEFVCATLPGSLLDDALVFSRSFAPAEFGGFLQVCEALELDATGHVLRVRGRPFDPSGLYRVALVRNFFTGMDGVRPLVDYARAHPESIPEAGSGRDVKLVLLQSFARSLWQQLGGFDRLDADNNGIVDTTDLERGLASHDDSAAATAGMLLRALDRDQDGRMTRDEDVSLVEDK